MIMRRSIREIKLGKVAAYVELMKKIEARYAEIGLPPVRRYVLWFGDGTDHTVVAEQEWESLAAFEAAIPLMQNDPELQALRPGLADLIEKSQRQELYGKV